MLTLKWERPYYSLEIVAFVLLHVLELSITCLQRRNYLILIRLVLYLTLLLEKFHRTYVFSIATSTFIYVFLRNDLTHVNTLAKAAPSTEIQVLAILVNYAILVSLLDS